MTLDQELIARLQQVADVTAEFSDLVASESYLLSSPARSLSPTLHGRRVIGPAVTLRYLPTRREPGVLRHEDPEGSLGNKRLAEIAKPGDVMVVQSPRTDVSVLGSEAAAALQAAGIVGAVVDGAVRDLEGLAALDFPCWTAGRTPITGRWRIETAAVGEPVAISGVQVLPGDVVVADDGGVVFVPADLFDELARRLVDRHRKVENRPQ